MPEYYFYIVVFGFAASIGSFLNVCIYRLPEGLSIVSPPSSCPSCDTRIRGYDNIPILSYLILRGKCRECGERISIKYPAIELLTAVLGMALYFSFGLTVDFFVYSLFTASLVVITFIDLKYQIIPDKISLPGIIIGFAASFILATGPGWSNSLIGIVAGGGSLLAVAVGYSWLTGKDGMGGGDIKLLAMMGAFLGWQAVIFIIMAASLSGSVIGGIALAITGKDEEGVKARIPFGPFLAIGALLYLFVGDLVIDFYLSMVWAG